MNNKNKTNTITKLIKLSACAIFIALILVALNSCNAVQQKSTEEEQKQVVTNYIEACNNLDTSSMMEYCNSDTNKLVNTATDMYGQLIDTTNSQDIAKLLASIYPGLQEFSNKTGVKFVLQPSSITIEQKDSTHATAKTKLDIGVSYEVIKTTVEQEKTYNLVKEGDSWKIDLTQDLKDALREGVNNGVNALSDMLNNQGQQ